MAGDGRRTTVTSAALLLQSVADEWRNNRETYDSPGDLMRTCLLKAGVSYLGLEALQIHTALFRDLFIENKNALPCVESGLGFCVRDYFELLGDEQLGWMLFLTKILPYLRLQKANNFLEKLVQFVRGFDGTSQNLADIQLCLFTLSLVQSIMLDFLLAERGGADTSSEVRGGTMDSPLLKRSLNAHIQQDSYVQNMASHMRTSVESLLQLCSVDKLSYLVSHNIHLFQQLVENLILAVVMLNPYLAVKDTSTLLLDSYVGQVFIPDISKRENNSKKTKKDFNRSTIKRDGCPFSDNFVWTEIVLQQPKSRLEKVELETRAEKVVEIDATSNVEIPFSTFSIFINNVRSHTPATLFVDLICWFCQSDAKNNKDIYKALADILFESKDIISGCSVLSGSTLYPWFVKFLQDLVKGLLVPTKTVEDAAKLQTIIAARLLPDRICDVSHFKMTEIGYILESGKELAGQEDMDLVWKAVVNKKSGWRELLDMGLRNKDINGWWRAGFFQLVSDNEAALSTERNVRQMLQVLCGVAVECQSPGDAEFRDSVNRLFGIMFKWLPALLQEQVVLSTLFPPRHGGADDDLATGGLHHLLSEEEVVEQLTPLLNRLTSAGVDKMVGHILFLCLFDVNVVIQKALQVALDNKAQVLPIVQVLRRMSSICCCSEPKSNQCKLLFGLHAILSGTVISDNQTDNIIRMLCLCTQRYSLDVDVDHKTHITKSMSGLLSQADVFEHFICPSLDSESLATRHQQEQPSQNPGSQDRESLDQDLSKQLDAGRETEVYRKEDEVPEDEPETHSRNESDYPDSEVVPLLPPEDEPETHSRNESHYLDSEVVPMLPLEDEPETHSRNESHYLDSEVVPLLPLDVALRTLSALLDGVDLLDIVALKPFPLLVILADMYARNCVVFKDGDLDKRMLLIKQTCQRSITLLTSAVWKYCSIFTRADFLWLKQRALECGWLCIAVLKPVLNIGCDVELHDILNSLASQLMLQDNTVTRMRGLVMLIQLALINDEMLDDLISVIKQSKLSAGYNQLVLALGCILASSLTSEMYRLVNIIIMLLANQEKPFPVDNDLLVPDVDPDILLRIQASQLLTDAVLQLSTSELAAAPWCHIVSNYQAAEQSLLQQKAPTLTLLVDVFCHCCTVLSVTDGQPAHILQVSAMDILTKLRACLSSVTEDLLDVRGGERLENNMFCLVGKYIECVCDGSVRATLLAQL